MVNLGYMALDWKKNRKKTQGSKQVRKKQKKRKKKKKRKRRFWVWHKSCALLLLVLVQGAPSLCAFCIALT